MKRLFLLPLLALMLCACPSSASQVSGAESDSTANRESEPKHITLLFAGDLMQHGVQYKAALAAGGGKRYDYEECFRYVKDEIRSADVAIANFETTLAGGEPSTYPHFNSPDSYLTACKDAGFDILLTANNHSVDTGAKGIRRTIERMDAEGIPHIGTYADLAERQREYPYMLDTLGFRIAILCFTYGTNGIAVPNPCIVNLIDTVQIRKDIQRARQQKPDCIIAFVHWGIEHALLPNAQQKSLADWMFRAGIDHVIGGHPHVVQPIELREYPTADGTMDKHLLVYSLGNYISNMPKPNNDGGLMVKMTLTKEQKSASSTHTSPADGNASSTHTYLSDASYGLTWVTRPVNSGRTNFRVYPASVPDSLLNAKERQLYNATITTERQLFQKHNKGGIEERPIPWKE